MFDEKSPHPGLRVSTVLAANERTKEMILHIRIYASILSHVLPISSACESVQSIDSYTNVVIN